MMAKRNAIAKDCPFTEGEIAEFHDMPYEARMQQNAENLSKEAIKAEISRLQGMLDAMEEEEKNNTPHKQLNLFE